jgi:FAD/FMN-containing dehydrogenase
MSVRSRSDAAVAEFAEAVGALDPVAVEGARTRWAVGGPPEQATRLLRAPCGIVAYQPEEMTVTVRAGTPVAELHQALADAGQWSALPDRGGTVGGALAVGENDLCCLGRGRVRDALLAVRYVSAEGKVISAGGPTVKNVSGFDLPRLLVGSLGTLGLLAEVTLRTNPVPPLQRWLRAEDADPFAVFATLLRPAAVLWDGTNTWAALAGHAPDVDAETSAISRLGSWSEVAGPPELPPQRWSLPPAELARRAGPAFSGRFLASVGVGTVWTSQPAPPRQPPAPLRRLEERVKREFDPTGRLNPGRSPGRS